VPGRSLATALHALRQHHCTGLAGGVAGVGVVGAGDVEVVKWLTTSSPAENNWNLTLILLATRMASSKASMRSRSTTSSALRSTLSLALLARRTCCSTARLP
jgi:hypothetical protein